MVGEGFNGLKFSAKTCEKRRQNFHIKSRYLIDVLEARVERVPAFANSHVLGLGELGVGLFLLFLVPIDFLRVLLLGRQFCQPAELDHAVMNRIA